MIKKKSLTAIGFFIFSFSLLSAGDLTLTDYLKGWIENDRDLKNASINLQKASLSNEKSLIQNGFDITLSSGNMTFKTINGDGKFTLSPSIKASLPVARNLSVNLESDISVSSSSNIENTSISASMDIINTDKEKRELTKKKNQRSVLEATRQIESKAQDAEKNFYNEIKSLLKTSESISNTKNTLYSDKITFEKIKTQGYSETSSSYRLAEMKVNNGIHSIETYERTLSHNYELFLLKCGFKENETSYEDFLSILGKESETSELKPLTFDDFKKENFKQLENALWTQSINSLSRESSKNYSLKGTAGYTFKNSNTNNSDTVNAGITSTVLGMNLSAGISMPVSNDASPAFTAGISFSPNTLRLQKIEKLEDGLSEESENLSIDTALSNYNLAEADNRQTVKDLEWSKSTVEENLSMYTKTEKDMKYYFDRGIITESEYLSAKSNKEKYEIEKILSLLDIIISNCQTQSLFYTDK